MRFGGRLGIGRLDLSPELNVSTDDDDVVDGGRQRKSQRAGATLDSTDSDSTATGDPEMTQPPSKARRTQYVQSPVSETNGVRPTTPSTSAMATRRTTSLLRSTSAAARGRTRGKLDGTWAYRESEAKTHTTTPVVRGARPSMCRKGSHTGERQQPKRKHCESVSTAQTFDTDDPDQQHIMHLNS